MFIKGKGRRFMDRKQEDVRKRFKSYLAESGCTSKFIAKRCGLRTDIISRFKNSIRDLNDESLYVLDNYLKEHNA